MTVRKQNSKDSFARASRRRFLKGAFGVSLGLPFLEGLAPRAAFGQTAAPVKRFGVFFACNGVNMDRWFPNGAYGELTDRHLLGTANEALLPFRRKLLFPRGVHMSPRGYGRDGGGGDDHGKGMAHKLTAQYASSEQWLAQGPSIDQILARAINPRIGKSRRPALNLMVGRPTGDRGLDFISYSEAGRAVAGINNPWTAYAQFLGLDQTAESAPALERLVRRRQSVMDLVSDQFADLRGARLSSNDRIKLDQHLTAVRDVELRLGAGLISCGSSLLEERARAYASRPELVVRNADYPTIADLQVDIFALALACDYTRVATLQFDRGAAGPTFLWDGMNHAYNHHKLSHGKNQDDCFGDDGDPNTCRDVDGYQDMLFDIDRWHQRKYARLLERLDGYVEEDGSTVLDNSAILYTNELSDGRTHNYQDLPYVLAGSAGGYFRTGRYLSMPRGLRGSETAPHNKLLNTLVNAMGVESDFFGVRDERAETMQGGVYESLLG